MPNKKNKSGSGDGYTPSRLGREGRPGDGSPGGSDPGTPRSGDGHLDVQGHVLMSQQLLTRASLGAGDLSLIHI